MLICRAEIVAVVYAATCRNPSSTKAQRSMPHWRSPCQPLSPTWPSMEQPTALCLAGLCWKFQAGASATLSQQLLPTATTMQWADSAFFLAPPTR